ncbi:unnamed protein product, partial [Discosporangium mesarthrocarpum]
VKCSDDCRCTGCKNYEPSSSDPSPKAKAARSDGHRRISLRGLPHTQANVLAAASLTSKPRRSPSKEQSTTPTLIWDSRASQRGQGSQLGTTG